MHLDADTSAAFAHIIRLTAYDHPELLIAGLHPAVSQQPVRAGLGSGPEERLDPG
ncbi:hypothetical protein GCM10027186_35940 [Micromonospora schwarzwaldensis]